MPIIPGLNVSRISDCSAHRFAPDPESDAVHMRAIQSRHSCLIALLGTVILGIGVFSGKPAPAQTQPDPPAKQKDSERQIQLFMRKKLAASNEILEGLCTDNLPQIAKAARQLHEMSAAEEWHVQNDVIYKQFSQEFRQITADLVKAADDKNLDRSLLKWMDATMSCVDCHRFVRGARIADSDKAEHP